MICFVGTSHAAVHLRNAAKQKGLEVCYDTSKASVIFISEDTPTDSKGNRNLDPIRKLVENVSKTGAQLVLTSQVCLLYTSDAADDMQCVDLGGRRIIKKIFFFQAEDGIRD